VKVPDGSRYGRVVADPDDGAVQSFVEKAEGSGPGWINAGLYCLSPSILDLIPEGRACSIERDVFPRLIGAGLFARRFTDATFLDIGTPDDFDRAQRLFGDVPDGSE
jgi:NDP-sugar pyrophosphorylase family protein